MVTVYVLESYEWIETELESVHTNLDFIEHEALRRSQENENRTFRITTWIDGNNCAQLRFFQNGREFTQDILKSIISAETC